MMSSDEIRSKFLEFFKQKGHAILASASLIPENDPSVLFTTAGMHPLAPYLLGEAHPAGTRLVSVQKCLRTGDIDEVGDNRHLTFFEMLGNWSLGDYFKADSIKWSYEFLTSPQWMALDAKNLAVTVFEGDETAPRDDESVRFWQSVGIPIERIKYLGKNDNWWPAGGKNLGPQGPDTEIFYWTGDGDAPQSFDPKNEAWVEIWNNVFMQFNNTAESGLISLAQKNVDTGMGLERMVMVKQNKKTVFETDLFAPIISEIEKISDHKYSSSPKAMRIIADHLRAVTFIIGDSRGVAPSNVDQGYVLRRLIRRAIRYSRQIGIKHSFLKDIAKVIIDGYQKFYPELNINRGRITSELEREEEKFGKTLELGLKEFERMFFPQGPAGSEPSKEPVKISGHDAFILYTTYGFPLELTEELAQEQGQKIDQEVFAAEFKKHQELSRVGAEQKFAGGLADHSESVVRMHTATHLLHQALRKVLGNHVEQRGSNITKERLRFDFSHPSKMTVEEIKRVEDLVNEQVDQDLPVHFEIVSVEQAKELGAIGLFEDKYAALGNKIKIYIIGDEAKGYFSKEICGGPHVEHTGLVGRFKIFKEEASSSGIRRIKAVVG